VYVFKKTNGWIKFGFALSIAWIAFASFIYFDELINHPSYAVRNNLHKYFNWEDDIAETARTKGKYIKISLDPDVNGTGSIKFTNNGWTILKPTFKAQGYFRFVLLPIILGWLLIFFVVWIRRRELFDKAIAKFKATDAISKYSIIGFVCFIFLPLLILCAQGCSIIESFILIVIGFGCLIGLMIFMALAWLFVYGLFYAANKAITDVKKNNHDK
jgi:hypothetical protein